jgi:outer membrane protein assembly factor BamA
VKRPILTAIVVLISIIGCKKDRKRSEPPGPLVREVEIVGNEVVDDETIVKHLNLQPTSPVTLGERSYYLPGLEIVDRQRIEEAYDAYGFYDAEVRDAKVRVARADKKVRRQRAYVTFTVDEGLPTRVRSLDFEWVGDTVAVAQRPKFEQACKLAPPARFGIVALGRGRSSVEGALQDAGYAYATVQESAQVDPQARLADVRFVVTPGEHKTIRALEVRGNARVPGDLIAREVDYVVGKPFSRKRMEQVESGVYAMGVFATVSVSRGPPTPGRDMTIVIEVDESKMQRVKLGPGIQIDPVRWQQHGTVQYEHRNLFKRLYGFTARLRAGYAELPAPYDPRQHGPIVDLDLELRKKGLLEKRLVWTESPGFELGIWEGYQFYSVTNRIGVSRFFTRFFELGLGYNNRFTDLFAIEPTLDRNRTVLGLDFRDPYFLAYFDLVPTIHLTDDIVDPSNGVRFSVQYDLANRYFGGQFNYQRIEPDLRAYYRPHERVQLAARGRIGLALPYGKQAAIPIDQKFYLGGSNDVRGWPLRRLSPRVSLCPEAPDRCRGTPVGGRTMVHASFELRVRMVADLWIATFADMGDVQDRAVTFDPGGLLYTTGGGLRYHSPFGIFRLDVGGQLNEDLRFPEPRRWAIHFGIGETF